MSAMIAGSNESAEGKISLPEDFIIVCDVTTDGLIKKVNERLKEKYELHGPPFVYREAICQAMIR